MLVKFIYHFPPVLLFHMLQLRRVYLLLGGRKRRGEGKKKRSINFNHNENPDYFQVLFHFKILLGAKYKRNLLLKF